MLYTPTEKNNNIKNDYLPEVERFRNFEEMSLLTHFNEERPLDKIRQYIQGAPWEVEFFTQYLNINDMANNPDLNSSIDVQQYIRIAKLIIFLQRPLEQTGIENLEVEAIINAGFLVKQGDCFVTTLVGGRRALFVAEEVNKEHYNLHQVFRVKFILTSFLEHDVSLYNNITSKVVRNYIYNKDFILDGTSPLLTKSEYSLKNDIQDAIDDSIDYYFRTFLDPDSRFLKLPNKNEQLHYIDQELNKFCRAVISVMEYPELTRVQTIDYQMDKSVKYTIWDVILNRNPSMIRKSEPYIDFKPSPYTRSNINSLHVQYMGVDYIVDKVDKPAKITGVISTDVPVDKAINVTPRHTSTIVEDRRDTVKSAKLWDMAIPGLDFKTDFSSLYHEPKPNIPPNPLQPKPDENKGIPDYGKIGNIYPFDMLPKDDEDSQDTDTTDTDINVPDTVPNTPDVPNQPDTPSTPDVTPDNSGNGSNNDNNINNGNNNSNDTNNSNTDTNDTNNTNNDNDTNTEPNDGNSLDTNPPAPIPQPIPDLDGTPIVTSAASVIEPISSEGLNTLVPNKESKPERKDIPLHPDKIPPIRTTKQYNLFPRKKE